MFDFDSVSRLNGYIKQSLADNPYLADFSVVGEISQYTVSSRGHAYFSIKDDQCVINCAIFARQRSQLKIEPEIGMKVKVFGGVDFYAQGGKLQVSSSINCSKNFRMKDFSMAVTRKPYRSFPDVSAW